MNGTETDKFTEENLGLVRLCANRFRGKGIEYDDLYSTGCIGLIKAVNGFDSERGVKFSTYAVPVILGEIKRLFRDGGTVKVSRSIKELFMKITRIKEDFSRKYGREPLISENYRARVRRALLKLFVLHVPCFRSHRPMTRMTAVSLISQSRQAMKKWRKHFRSMLLCRLFPSRTVSLSITVITKTLRRLRQQKSLE